MKVMPYGAHKDDVWIHVCITVLGGKRARKRARKFFPGPLVASPFVHALKRHRFKPMSMFFDRQFGPGGPTPLKHSGVSYPLRLEMGSMSMVI